MSTIDVFMTTLATVGVLLVLWVLSRAFSHDSDCDDADD